VISFLVFLYNIAYRGFTKEEVKKYQDILEARSGDIIERWVGMAR